MGSAAGWGGDLALPAGEIGAPAQVCQPTAPLIVGGNAAAVVDDGDDEAVGDGHLDVQGRRPRVPDSVADRLPGGRFGVAGQGSAIPALISDIRCSVASRSDTPDASEPA